MEASEPGQKRRSPRSKLLMAASLELPGGIVPITLRDLSADGALVEGDHHLSPGCPVIFRKNDLQISGTIAWADGRRAGIAFHMSLDPESVRRYVPVPKPRVELPYGPPRPRRIISFEERRFGRKPAADEPPGPA